VNLRALRTFVVVAEAGGFSRAGGRLNLSQSAASRQILALEADLGVSLFDRIGRRIQLTSEGKDLLELSGRLLADADLLTERARALKGGQTGTLTAAANPQLITALLAPFLRGYRKRYPGVELQIIEGGAADQYARLERGEAHIALMPAGDERMAGRLLSPVYTLAVLLKSHRLARRAVLEVGELTNEPLLLMRREFGSRAWFEAACQIAQARPKVLLESTTAHTLIEMAAVGYGVAVVPSTAAIRNPELRAVPLVLHGESIGQWSMICWSRQRLPPPYAERFVDELVAYAERHFPGREFTRHAPSLRRPKELITRQTHLQSAPSQLRVRNAKNSS
jgi:LysR family transcriptional regulator, cyn operon transcriptional activator